MTRTDPSTKTTNMKSIAILFLLTLPAWMPVNAQRGQEGTTNDPKARKILDRLSEKHEEYSSITASFTNKMVNKKDDLSQSQEGELSVKGDKYRMELEEQKVVSNGKLRWTYLKSENEVHIHDADEAEEGELVKPSQIFTIWESGFKYKHDGKSKVNGKTCDVIELYPKEPGEKSYHTVKLEVDSKNDRIRRLTVLGKGGTNYIYLVKDFNTNNELSKSTFEFKKSEHPGVEVVDFR